VSTISSAPEVSNATMPPASSLTALLASPAASNSSTVLAGKTMPDVTLGSLGSSFRSEDQATELNNNNDNGHQGKRERAVY
jgi:hypothetical protein